MMEHGRSKYVNEKCRCDICRAANTDYFRNTPRPPRRAETMEGFFEDQRVRVVNSLRPPINENWDEGHFYIDGIHPLARKNEYLSRARIHRECQLEILGNVAGHSSLRA